MRKIEIVSFMAMFLHSNKLNGNWFNFDWGVEFIPPSGYTP